MKGYEKYYMKKMMHLHNPVLSETTVLLCKM